MYWVYPEKKLGQYSGIKIQNPENEKKNKYCSDGGECYYLFDEDTVGCNCTFLYGAERCEIYMWWTQVRL